MTRTEIEARIAELRRQSMSATSQEQFDAIGKEIAELRFRLRNMR